VRPLFGRRVNQNLRKISVLVARAKNPDDEKRPGSRNVGVFTLQEPKAAANPDSFAEVSRREAWG